MGEFTCVGVLQLLPMLSGGGLKQGVFSLEWVGVCSGDIPCVGVLSGLNVLVGVVLPFRLLIVPVSSLSLGSGGSDISES